MRSFIQSTSAFALLAIACSSGESPANGNGRGPIETRHRLSIGVVEGEAPYEFGRIMNAVKLSDGRIAVADFGNSEIRLFDAGGTFQRSIGRKGGGPGEFLALTRLALSTGDTLLGGGRFRIARFAPSGELLGDVQVPVSESGPPPWRSEAVWPLANGHFLVKSIRSPALQLENGLSRTPELYVAVPPNGVGGDTLGVFLGLSQMTYERQGKELTAIPLLAASTRPAVTREHVVIGDMAEDSVVWYSVATGETRWIKAGLDRRRFTKGEWERAKESLCTHWSDPQRCLNDQAAIGEQLDLPYYRGLAVDSVGNIWLGRIEPARITENLTRWLVISPEGGHIAEATLPSNVDITQIGRTYVLGISRDHLGVQRVEEFVLGR